MTSEKKFCPYCGHENGITYRYCAGCGFEIPKVSFSEPTKNPQSRTNYSTSTVTEKQSQPNIIIAPSTKSVGLAIVLTIFFGPLGLFYASVIGGLIMIFIPIIFLYLSYTGNLSILLGFLKDSPLIHEISSASVMGTLITTFIIVPLLYWLICIIWAVIAVNSYNNNVYRQVYRGYY